MLPLSVKPASGYSPLLPLNEASTVGLPPLRGTLKTVPSSLAPPSSVVPYRVLPLSVKPASGICAVAAVERGQHRGAAAAQGNAEDRAVVIRTAAIGSSRTGCCR